MSQPHDHDRPPAPDDPTGDAAHDASGAPAGPPTGKAPDDPTGDASPPGARATDAPGLLSADEVLDVVDERDRVIGQERRADVYARRLRHRCAFVLVRDAHGRVFVHRRTDRKLIFPSRYDMFVGGVLGTGESYDQAALREAEEELGVSGLPQPKPLFRFLYTDRDRGSWWSAVYEVRCDLPVRPQPEEVAWHTFLTDEELTARLVQWPWVPDGLEAYHRLLAWRVDGHGDGHGEGERQAGTRQGR